MKTTSIFRQACLAISLLVLTFGNAQVSTPNNSPFVGDYVGCDGGTTFPLQVRHNNNHRIEWYTDSIQRMQLNATTTDSIGYFANQVKDGSLLLCPDVDQFYANGAPGPYSLLHLADADGPNTASYRDWMRIGVSFTTNNDHMYVGHKVEDGVDQTAAVIHKQRLRRPRSMTGS